MARLPDKQTYEIKEAFAVWDTDKDGKISTKELGAMVRSLGASPTEAELRTIVARFNAERGGCFTLKELLEIMQQQQSKAMKEENLISSFKVFDPTNTGFIATVELRRMMIILGEPLSNTEVNEMIKEAEGPPGKVDYKKYVKTLLTR